jgi:ElaB/YqjD/DUF883 family membrane-anchored ribosome-binding protein
MKAFNSFSILFATHAESQIEQRQRESIEDYIQNYGFNFSSDKTKIIGQLVDSVGNIVEIEENVNIDITKEVLRLFKLGLSDFKRNLNENLLSPEYNTNRLETLKAIKFQLESLLNEVNDKFPNSYDLVINESLKPAIAYTDNYIQQLYKSNTIVIKPIKLNWNSSIVSLCRFIMLSKENNSNNKNQPYITNEIHEILDFVAENVTYFNKKINRDTLVRSTKEERINSPSGFTRIKKPKKKTN